MPEGGVAHELPTASTIKEVPLECNGAQSVLRQLRSRLGKGSLLKVLPGQLEEIGLVDLTVVIHVDILSWIEDLKDVLLKVLVAGLPPTFQAETPMLTALTSDPASLEQCAG